MFKVVSSRRKQHLQQFYKLLLFSVIIVLQSFADGFPSLNTRSQLQLYPENNPWIGSHNLNFSPNPFLTPKYVQKSARSLNDVGDPDGSNYILIASTAESPLSPPSTEFPSLALRKEEEVIIGKRKPRRKVKGFRRRPIKKRKTREHKNKEKHKTGIKGAKNRLKLKPRRRSRVKMLIVPKSTMKSEQETPNDGKKLIENDFNTGKLEFFHIDKVSINPSFMKRNVEPTIASGHSSFSTTELPMITPPSIPIKVEVDPTNNQIQIDYSTNPENLNLEYFRNVIMQAMMEKLVKAGIVTEPPNLQNLNVPDNVENSSHKILKRQ